MNGLATLVSSDLRYEIDNTTTYHQQVPECRVNGKCQLMSAKVLLGLKYVQCLNHILQLLSNNLITH